MFEVKFNNTQVAIIFRKIQSNSFPRAVKIEFEVYTTSYV
jgi:predicted DNA-binding transcriptional regulator AlpA